MVTALNGQARERRHGAALLECILALALFVACGMAVLAMVDRAVSSVASPRDAEQAADIARSAMAKIEAGIATPETLNGPVTAWTDDQENKFKNELPTGTAWMLEIQSEPSSFTGLAKISVRAFKQASPGSDNELASYTLYQLVRLTEKDEQPRAAPASSTKRVKS